MDTTTNTNKDEFANKLEVLSKDIHSKAEALRVVDDVLHLLQSELSAGNSISFINFGKFEVYKRKERAGRNPKTGEVITIPTKNMVRFKAGKGLLAAIA